MDKQQRSRELETLAQENSWNYSAVGNVAAIENFEFQTGEKRNIERIENLIESDNLKVFDVYWKQDFNVSDAFGPMAQKDMTAKNAREQTMILFESDQLQLSKFYVYPRDSNNWLNNWIDKVFLQSNFSDYPDFEKRWVVRGLIKNYFTPEVIEFYEKNEDFWTFANETKLFIYQMNVLLEPAQIVDWANKIKTLANLLKH